MAETGGRPYRLEVVSPERVLYDTSVRSVSLMAEDGSLGIRYGHAPLVTTIVPCRMEFEPEQGGRAALAIGEGFLEVVDNHVRVLVDSAERPDEIDAARAAEAKQRAETRLARRGLPDVDYARAEASLRRAVARLKTVGRA